MCAKPQESLHWPGLMHTDRTSLTVPLKNHFVYILEAMHFFFYYHPDVLVVDSFILSFVVLFLFQDIYFVLKTVEQYRGHDFVLFLFLGGSFSCRLANIQGISYLFFFFMHHYFVTSSWFSPAYISVWCLCQSDV